MPNLGKLQISKIALLERLKPTNERVIAHVLKTENSHKKAQSQKTHFDFLCPFCGYSLLPKAYYPKDEEARFHNHRDRGARDSATYRSVREGRRGAVRCRCDRQNRQSCVARPE